MLRPCLVLYMVVAIQAKFEPFIVGGAYTQIEKHPHAACIFVVCMRSEDKKFMGKCGASILNQMFILTAAHCLNECNGKETNIIISVGSRHCMQGEIRFGSNWAVHENYDQSRFHNDVGIIKMSSPVKLNASISRVAIMKQPPYYDNPAQVAGWGLISVQPHTETSYLKNMDVLVWNRHDCLAVVNKYDGYLPNGTICGSGIRNTDSIDAGDSGSALVVHGYIQIGIASFTNKRGDGPLVSVYTDVGHYYHWIRNRLKKMYCIQ